MYQYGLIGCGHMGSALLTALCESCDPQTLLLANRRREKAQALADRLGCPVGDNKQIAAECSTILLGVKPQIMPEVLAEIAPVLAARKDRVLLVSMAAGLSLESLERMAGGAYPIIRIMPNTPVALGEGVILLCANQAATQADEQQLMADLSAAGLLCPLSEAQLDMGSALSGCGPAFAYLFLEALADGAVACGLPRAAAQQLAAQTLLGAAKMALQPGANPAALKDAVTSPGGTTIAGIHALEKDGFRAAAMDAVTAAYAKTLELQNKAK